MYALVGESECGNYEDGSTYNRWTLGTDTDKERLIARYNDWSERRCELGTGGSGSYMGSTGGGHSFVSVHLHIEEIKQFDNKLVGND